jgi:threonine dehydrogenase-like Zn-dependent dehydrogenase
VEDLMPDTSLAAAAVGDCRFELVELDVPPVGAADGLLRVEASGVCGSDFKKYRVRDMSPTVLGHETVGRIERVGDVARQRWAVDEGDRVLLEEYLPCGHCSFCRSGEFRSCRVTDNAQAGALRYGSTPIALAPGLWGGNSQFQFLHPNSVLHRVPDEVPAEHVTFAIPLSNGIQWSRRDGGVDVGDSVLIQGPGQQGISCVVGSRMAGAEQVIVSGRHSDRHRLQTARRVGADLTIDAEHQEVVEVVRASTGGAGADVVIDVSGGGAATASVAFRAVRRGGTVVLASGGPPGEVSLDLVRKKQITVRGVRGHSFWAVETALRVIASGRVDLESFCTAPYPLAEIDAAYATATDGSGDHRLHVSIGAWM